MKKVILIFLGIQLSFSTVFAQKGYIEVGGNIYESATWNADTVKIIAETIINAGAIINIAQGTVVEFQNNYALKVDGGLLAEGVAGDSIKFTALDPEIGWGGIRIIDNMETDSIIFDYCIIENGITYAEHPVTGDWWYGGVLHVENFNFMRVSNCAIRNNKTVEGSGWRGIGGFQISSSKVKITNNKFVNNESAISLGSEDTSIIANNEFYNNYSCALRHKAGFAEIKNNYFENNFNEEESGTTIDGGGAIYVDGDVAEAYIHNNTFYRNQAETGGAMVLVDTKRTKVINNKFYNNTNTTYGEGGAIAIYTISTNFSSIEDAIVFAGNDIANNSAEKNGGAIYMYLVGQDEVFFINNNIVNNEAKLNNGGAIFLEGASPNFYNNIIFGNRVNHQYGGNQVCLEDKGSYEADPNFYNCNIEGGFDDFDIYEILSYDGEYLLNIDQDPLFTDPTDGVGDQYEAQNADWNLLQNSPCINGGTADITAIENLIPEIDINGNPRIYGNRIDIGAYEDQSQTLTVDVAVTMVEIISYCKPQTEVMPIVSIKNQGIENIEEPFDIELTIGNTTETITVNSLSTGETYTVDDYVWIAEEGEHLVTAQINIPNDQFTDNDYMETFINVVSFDYQVFAFLGATGLSPHEPGIVTFDLEEPQKLYPITQETTENWITTSTWAEDKWYGTTSGGDFITIDTLSGERTVLGNFPMFYTGLAYDDNTQTMYAINYDNVVDEVSYLYTMNLTNGQWTLIQQIPDLYFTMLACDHTGKLYAVDGMAFNLYSIDPTTGDAELIGNLGYSAIFSQDLEYDKNQKKLYCAAFNFDENRGELREVNTVTGNSTVIGTFEGGAELTAFAIPYPIEQPNNTPELEKNNDYHIKIYPNPTTGIVNLSGFQSTDAMPCVSTVKITDITGKQIQNFQYSIQNNQYSVDLSELENGVYLIKIETSSNIHTYKIIKN